MSGLRLKKAMILAAGFGTRLKPLTDKTPKALVPYNGKPMIENVIQKLTASGIEEIFVNTHYLSSQVEDYFARNKFDATVTLIHEEEILGTGGGIKNAEKFLWDSGDFLVYNVDVDSDTNLKGMFDYHKQNGALATLALKKRETERPVVFDENLRLIGNKNSEGEYIYTAYEGEKRYFGFTGIHIISSEIFKNFHENGFFDIFRTYFRLIKEPDSKKNMIIGFDIGTSGWRDLGKII